MSFFVELVVETHWRRVIHYSEKGKNIWTSQSAKEIHIYRFLFKMIENGKPFPEQFTDCFIGRSDESVMDVSFGKQWNSCSLELSKSVAGVPSSGIKTAWHRRCMEEMRCRMVRAEAVLCSSSRALASCSSVGGHRSASDTSIRLIPHVLEEDRVRQHERPWVVFMLFVENCLVVRGCRVERWPQTTVNMP